jgi:hypothetical protein
MLKIARILTTKTGILLSKLVTGIKPHNSPVPYFLVSALDFGYVKVCTKISKKKPSVYIVRDPVFYKRFKNSFEKHRHLVVKA